MKPIAVIGKMGSGKTTWCKKNIAQNYQFQKPILYVSLDEIASIIRESIFSSSKAEWKRRLFYDPQKEQYWNLLESSVHPVLFSALRSIWNEYKNQKGTMLIDGALPKLIMQSLPVQKVYFFRIKKNYTTIKKLQKHRSVSIQQIFLLWKKQEKWY